MANIILRKLSKTAKSETFDVKKNQEFTLVLLAVSAADYQANIILKGQGARANIIGIVIGKNADEIKIKTLQKHASGDTLSDLHIKSILTGRSQFFYEGYIDIAKNAQKSNAYQRNDNLILSDEAKAESKPALEILANDVRCTHGATIGKIDPEQLFYLQSRGVSKDLAEKLIISGFFQVLIDKINDDKIRSQIIKQLKKEDYAT